MTDLHTNPASVEDFLRTRIAAAIVQTCHGVYLDDAVDAADAVIRELGMTIETDGPPIVPPCHRYVTWELISE